MRNIAISISQEDIVDAQRYHLPALLFVLVRTTGTLWRISECGVALELIAPYRTFVLPEAALFLWQHSRQNGQTIPHQFQVECHCLKTPASTQSAMLTLAV